MFNQFLRHICTRNVTFLSDINKEFFINQSNKSNYQEIRTFEMGYFYDFITNLSHNSLYTVIPMIYIKGKPDEPYLVLSKSILVTKYSDYKLIHHYIFERYLKSKDSFEIIDEDFLLVLKYKKVNFDKEQFERKFGK